MNKCVSIICFSLFILFKLNGQTNFRIEVEPMSGWDGVALHSGAQASYEGLWYFLGGRVNGLHGFDPPFGFPIPGVNSAAWQTDPALGINVQVELASLLPDTLFEAISCSNMQYCQRGKMLYMVGGYGWSTTANDYITFPYLTAVDLERLRLGITEDDTITKAFRQIKDARFQVCGGGMGRIDSVFYLVFGHNFNGRYDESDTSGFFTQEYTHAIRSFKIHDDGHNLWISDYSEIVDTTNFRRRDFNLLPWLSNSGEYQLKEYAGVFQKDINLPYLTSIDIGESGYSLVPFNQYLNHYTSAAVSLFDDLDNSMYSLFFGGISEYKYDTLTDMAVRDSTIPFVNTVSMIKRDGAGIYSEEAMPIAIGNSNAFRGTNAYFILHDSVRYNGFDIVDVYALNEERNFIGYIVGGIESPDENISQTDASVSFATPASYKVYLVRDEDTSTGFNKIKIPIEAQVIPNPTTDVFKIEISGNHLKDLVVEVLDSKASLIKEIPMITNVEQFSAKNLGLSKGVYYLRISVNNFISHHKLVVQ